MTSDRCELLCLDLQRGEALRHDQLDPALLESAAAGAKALGDPTRLSLAALLGRTEELCVCDLSWISGRAENLVSHHLRQLRAAGLVEGRRDGKMVMYSLSGRGRELLETTLPASARA